nr:Scr1 family TA system antitoxin-like transcriptional regulator [Streptomyces marincola]
MEYQPLLIPGQLQTEGYATAITGPGFAPLSPDLRSSGRRVV